MHGSGASVGWIRRGAAMFAVDEPEAAGVVLAGLKRWISGRPSRAGLSTAMPDTAPLAGMVTGPVPPRRHRSLVLHRFTQAYRGVPVVGAVTVTVAPGYGAVSVSGAIVDARDDYDGWGAALSPQAAVAAAGELLALEGGELEESPFTFGEPRLVAVAEVRALAWELEVARFGHSRGTLLLRASDGGMLAFSPAAHAGPEDEVAIKIRARTFASDFFSLQHPDKQIVADIADHPLTGGPLLGSTYTPLVCDDDPDLAVCGQIRLGNRHIIVLDDDHQDFPGDLSSHPYIGASPSVEFLATPPASADEDSPMRRDAAMQDYFYRLQATYSLIDKYNAGKWEPHRETASDFPALEYKPRVVLANHADILKTCGVSQPGCAKMYWPHKYDVELKTEVYDEHPEGDLPAHVWQPGDVHDEGMGYMAMGVDSFTSPDLVFHEFGHVVDLFMTKGFIGYQVSGSGCTMHMDGTTTCVAACVPDSTDEVQALAETVADMFSVFSVGQLYTTVPYARCNAVSGITGVSGPAHDPACITDAGDIKSFLDQRPSEPDMSEHDGVWLPTGMCTKAPGYKQSAVLQAWWEWTHGRSCSPVAPYACEQFMDEEDGARSGIEALLFAMGQTNETYYKKLFTDMELYIACTDGPAHASRFREVFCHHGALDCAEPPPLCPALCGNGDAEQNEACDGDDLRDQDCFDRGFDGGALGCSLDCTYDVSACADPTGTADATSPIMTTTDVPTMGWEPPAASSSATGASEDTVGEQATDGCGCRHRASSPAGWLALALFARRRRRRVDSMTSGGVR